MDLYEILDKEEKLWASKSRTKWIRDVNINTKFYLISTLIKRRTNKIFVIKDSMGNWIFDINSIQDEFQSYFQKLFSFSKIVSMLILI